MSPQIQAEAEAFSAFYQRTTGVPFPGYDHEPAQVVFKRIAEVMAAWADEVASRATAAAAARP